MTEQPATSPDSAHFDWQSPSHLADTVSIGTTVIRTTRRELCPECGERVHSTAERCAACGESLTQAPKPIRCMHCHTIASSELTVCPGCGRELREAPPRLVTLGAPALLALLLVALLVTQWERISPLAWARSNLARGVVLVENMSASIEPEMVIVMTPIVPEGPESNPVVAPAGNVAGSNATGSNTVSETHAVALAPGSVVTPLPDPNAQAGAPQGVQPSVMAVSATHAASSGIGGPQAGVESVEAELAPESAPSASQVTTDVPAPTSVPTTAPTDAPSPTAVVAAVEPAGEAQPRAEGLAATLAVAEPTRTPTPTWTAAADAGDEPETVGASMAQVAALAASETSVPTATPTPTVAVTPLPTPTPTPLVYQVRSGDTLISIAAQYEVTVDELMAANDIREEDVYVLQPGQMLIVPVPTPEVAVEPAMAEPTVAEPAAVRLEAPVLLIPADDATVGCATGGKLIWQRVQFVKDSDKYVLHLGFVSGQSSDEQESITWVLAQSSPVTQTEWALDTSLCDLAPDEFGREWRWWVEVVEEVDRNTVSVSPPSETWGFTWE